MRIFKVYSKKGVLRETISSDTLEGVLEKIHVENGEYVQNDREQYFKLDFGFLEVFDNPFSKVVDTP